MKTLIMQNLGKLKKTIYKSTSAFKKNYQVKGIKINPTNQALDNAIDSINKTDMKIKIYKFVLVIIQ